MASIPPDKPNRVDPQSPPERRQPPEPAIPPALPETEPDAPDVDEPGRCPDECPPE